MIQVTVGPLSITDPTLPPLGPITTSSFQFFFSSFAPSLPVSETATSLSVFSAMASNRNGVQRGSAKFDRPLKPRPRPSSPSPGSALRRPTPAARNGDAGESLSKP
ncbi:armadillo repeat-containing kinesin protein 2 [Spatholobus suberectus]|nr:armadillo repeat-containing kinesin protein 2 [Spatholobus suberectus]